MDAATVTAITTAVSFDTIVVGIGAICASIALVLIARKGGRMLLGMIK